MLDRFIDELGQELNIRSQIATSEDGPFTIPFNDGIEIEAYQIPQGNYTFKGKIGICPPSNTESFLIKAMEANLFGRGTFGSAIGLNEEGNLLTLTQEVDYNCNYKEWRDKLEDFLNILDFWRKETLSHH